MDDIKLDGIPNKAKSNENYLPFLHCTSSFNPVQDESFFLGGRGGSGGQKAPHLLFLKYVTHILH